MIAAIKEVGGCKVKEKGERDECEGRLSKTDRRQFEFRGSGSTEKLLFFGSLTKTASFL